MRRIMLGISVVMLVVMVTSVLVRAQQLCLRGKSYSAAAAMNAVPDPGNDDFTGKNFKASGGEHVSVAADIVDSDTEDLLPLTPADSEFTHKWTLQGKASFDAVNNVQTKTVDGILRSQVTVYIRASFAAGDVIIVSDECVDNGRTILRPDTGTTKDASVTKTWNIAFKTKCPTGLNVTAPADALASQPAPGSWTYQGTPGPHPAYPDVTILESFGTVTSNIDKTVHIKQAGLNAHPGWTNDQWRDYFFGAGDISTFVLDGDDSFVDAHLGFTKDSSLMVFPPPAGKDLWWDLPQTYTCNSPNGNLSKSYTVRRTLGTDGSVKVTKS